MPRYLWTFLGFRAIKRINLVVKFPFFFIKKSNKLNWGVSDHHKESPDQIIFWKYHCALMDQNNFMKQKGLFIVILNHSEFLSGGYFYIVGAFWSF